MRLRSPRGRNAETVRRDPPPTSRRREPRARLADLEVTARAARSLIAHSGAEEHRHPAPHRLASAPPRGRQRTSDELLLGRGHRGRAVLRRDAVRPEEPHNADSDRFVLSKGHAAPMLYAAWAEAGAFAARRAAEAARARLGSRRPSDAAPAVRGRRDRIARPGHLRRRSASRSTRAASDPTTAPTCCSATANRPKARSGKRPTSPRSTSSTISAPSPTSTRSARAARRCGSTTWRRSPRRWRAFGWHAIVIDGHDLDAILDALRRSARHQGPPDDDPGAHDQGQGRVVRRRQGRLARQGVQEGRRARPRARRARGAVRAAAGRTPIARSIPQAGRRVAPPDRAEARCAPPAYKLGDQVATREAYGTALAKLGEADDRASSRSTPTSRTRRSATSSRRRSRIASTRTSSPSR